MILEVGSRYKDNPNQLKSDLDNIFIQNSIKEAKITVSKYLVIIFNDYTGYEHFMNKYTRVSKRDQKVINLKKEKKKSYEKMIKGANYKYYENYTFQLTQMGISEIKQMNKRKSRK
jgi:hypothetical protein